MPSARPIIVVTGANSGIGFGTCRRLLSQLSYKAPPDSLPQASLKGTSIHKNGTQDGPVLPCEGLTLILACRSVKRAETAKSRLLALLDEDIMQRKQLENYDGFADTFKRNLRIEVHYVDMGSVQTIFQFADELSQKYPYVSHLICNAGLASFTGINWTVAIPQVLSSPIMSVTSPQYNRQRVGEKSVDGLGWVWQCNVFGHYVLFRALQPLLSLTPRGSLGPARVLWTTSVEASPTHYDPADWQLIRTSHSYQCSKFQTDLIGSDLDRRARLEGGLIRHILIQPGVAHTGFGTALIFWLLEYVKLAVFYLARWAGSPNHPINIFKAAIAGVHLTLIPLSLLPAYVSTFASSSSASDTKPKPFKPSVTRPSDANAHGHANKRGSPTFTADETESLLSNDDVSTIALDDTDPDYASYLATVPVRYGSETDRLGRERVGVTTVQDWAKYGRGSTALVDRCEALYLAFLKKEKLSASGSDSDS